MQAQIRMLLKEQSDQASKYLKISTCPASQKMLAYIGKNSFSLKISKFPLALQPEALVNTSGRVQFSSPADSRGARDSKIGKKWPESSRILDYILSYYGVSEV